MCEQSQAVNFQFEQFWLFLKQKYSQICHICGICQKVVTLSIPHINFNASMHLQLDQIQLFNDTNHLNVSLGLGLVIGGGLV